MSEKKQSRRSNDRRALETANELLLKAHELLNSKASDMAQYAMNVGGAKYYLGEALKEIATAQGGWK